MWQILLGFLTTLTLEKQVFNIEYQMLHYMPTEYQNVRFIILERTCCFVYEFTVWLTTSIQITIRNQGPLWDNDYIVLKFIANILIVSPYTLFFLKKIIFYFATFMALKLIF